MANYSIEIKFFTSKNDETGTRKEIHDFLKGLNQNGNYFDELTEDNKILLTSTPLENSVYPVFLDDLAAKLSDRSFIAYEIYNEEGAGVPFYTLSYLKFSDGKIDVENIDQPTETINEMAEDGDWESMEEELSDFFDDESWQQKCEHFFSGDTQDGIVYVTEKNIPQYAYENVKGITKIILPEYIEDIGVCAFSGCPNLRTIIFPDSESSKEISAHGFMIAKSFNIDSKTLSELDKRFDYYEMWGAVPSEKIYFIHKGLKEIFENNSIPYNFSNYLEFILFPDEEDAFRVKLNTNFVLDNLNEHIKKFGTDKNKLIDFFDNIRVMGYKIQKNVIDTADEDTECILRFNLSEVKDFLDNIALESYQEKEFLNCVSFRGYKDEKDGQRKVCFEYFRKAFAVQKYTDIVIKPGLRLPRYSLSLDIVKYLSKYEGEAKLKTLYRKVNDHPVYFIRIENDEFAKVCSFESSQYVNLDKIIPVNVPNSVTMRKKELFDCISDSEFSDVFELQIGDNTVKIISQNGDLLKEVNADVKGEKINIKFKSLNLHRLCKFAPEENITLQYTDEEKPVKLAQKDIVFIARPWYPKKTDN